MNLFTLFFGKAILTKKLLTIKKYGVGINCYNNYLYNINNIVINAIFRKN